MFVPRNLYLSVGNVAEARKRERFGECVPGGFLGERGPEKGDREAEG